MKMDDNPDEYRIKLERLTPSFRLNRSWGPYEPGSFHQKAVCVRRDYCFQIVVTDSGGDGFKNGGFVRVFQNGRIKKLLRDFSIADRVVINC